MLQTHSEARLVSQPLNVQQERQVASLPLRIVAACLVALAVAVHYTDYGPLIPMMLDDLHIVSSQAGLMSTMLFLGLAITYLPGGILVDRYGQRPVLILSLILMSVGGILLPLWPNIYWLLACRALIGFGSGAAFIAGAGIVAGMEKWTALAQGLYGGVIQIGSALGLLVTPFLAGQAGWQGAFLCWGSLSILALIAWLCLYEQPQVHAVQQTSVFSGLCSPAVWSLGLAHMGTFGVGNAIFAWIAVYLVHQYSISLAQAALFGAGGLLLGALARPLGGLFLGDRLCHAVLLLRISTILTSLGICALAVPIHQPVLVLCGISAVAIGSTLPYTPVYASAAHLRTVSQGIAQGLLSVIACQTILWGPPFIGLLFQITNNFSLPFGSMLFFCLIAINASFLAGQVLDHEKRRDEVYTRTDQAHTSISGRQI